MVGVNNHGTKKFNIAIIGGGFMGRTQIDSGEPEPAI